MLICFFSSYSPGSTAYLDIEKMIGIKLDTERRLHVERQAFLICALYSSPLGLKIRVSGGSRQLLEEPEIFQPSRSGELERVANELAQSRVAL